MGLTASLIGGAVLYHAAFCMANWLTGTGSDEAGSPVYDRRMTRQVRIVLWILAALLLLPILITPVLGFYPPLLLLYYGWPLVLLAMAWGILDAAYHRDSVWREADQSKVVWVLVQFIPFVGTMAYYILVHPTVLDAEKPGAAKLDRLPAGAGARSS